MGPKNNESIDQKTKYEDASSPEMESETKTKPNPKPIFEQWGRNIFGNILQKFVAVKKRHLGDSCWKNFQFGPKPAAAKKVVWPVFFDRVGLEAGWLTLGKDHHQQK